MKLASALIVALTLLLSTAGRASADEASTLTVSGEGSVSRTPDLAVVDVALVTRDGASAAKATAQNNAAYARLRDRLQALGLRDDAVRTTGFSVQYHPQPPPDGRVGIPPIPPSDGYGYVATRTIGVNAPRIDAAGRVVDAVVGAGGRIDGVRYLLADPRAATSAALAAAVADAQNQAKAVADAAHMRIASIKSIDVSSAPLPVAFARAMVAGAAQAPSVPTELEPTSLEVRAGVNVTYTIAP